MLAAVGPTLVAGFVGLLGAATVVAGALVGMTTTPVTSPFTPSFCLAPIVCRAERVAALFATAAAFSSTVRGTRGFEAIPKSASTSGEAAKDA